jgi:hypothetical protein
MPRLAPKFGLDLLTSAQLPAILNEVVSCDRVENGGWREASLSRHSMRFHLQKNTPLSGLNDSYLRRRISALHRFDPVQVDSACKERYDRPLSNS